MERRGAALKRELGIADLVLMQVLYVVGSAWVGTAALLGRAHVAFWIAAILLFYLPQGAVVVWLSRLLPIEGGVYQWAAAAFGDFAGFLVAWNLWTYTITVMATFAVIVARNLAYLLGPALAWLTGAWWYGPAVTVLLIAALVAVTTLGLRAGKWVQNVGGVAQLLTFAALIAVPFVALWNGTLTHYAPLRAAMPSLTARSLNIFGKLAVGALSGFEYVAILAGECRSPARTVGRSVVVAAPIIALMFVLGTGSTLALVPTQQIDLVSPIPQTLLAGFAGLPIGRLVVPALILLLLARQLGATTMIFAGNTRLPMVAGWDGLVPSWFSRLHPRHRTPRNSILFVGAVTLALSLAGQAGVGVQEAYQLLDNAAGILYALTYLGLFAIPLFGARRLGVRVPLWLRLAALAGFGVTLLYSVLSIFPIIEVASWQLFSAKVLTVIVGTNVVGLAIYALGRRRPTPR